MVKGAVEAKATKTAVVYDTRTGEVVHVPSNSFRSTWWHMSRQGNGEDGAQLAPGGVDRARLGVLHDKGREFSPAFQYRVDVKSRMLVADRAPLIKQHAPRKAAAKKRKGTKRPRPKQSAKRPKPKR